MTVSRAITAARSRRSIFLPLVLLAFICVTPYFTPSSSFAAPFIRLSTKTRAPAVDIPGILTATPDAHRGKAFSWDAVKAPDDKIAVVGHPATRVMMHPDGIYNPVTRQKWTAPSPYAFNLALLKLPHGSKWGYVGVARGPETRREWLQLANSGTTLEQILLVFGLNATREGELVMVTPATILDLHMDYKVACERAVLMPHGPEDPRLFWTDAGTPALIYGRYSDHVELCRGLGIVDDLRDVYAPLHDALLPGENVAPWPTPLRLPGQAASREVHLEEGQQFVEKNWVPFFPGPLPDRTAIVPLIHYGIVPNVALEPVVVDEREVEYGVIASPRGFDAEQQGKCIADNHAWYSPERFHQATPLYRLTLCERGCQPGDENTVLFTMVQAQQLRGRSSETTYRKFIAVFNITSPHEMISVGPMFSLAGKPEAQQIVYALSMVPLEPADLDPDSPRRSTSPDVNPGHFFIDDDVFISLGIADREQFSVRASVRDVIGRQRLCRALEVSRDVGV